MKINSPAPLVSVAIITFNQKPFLKECIDSVLAQDYENVEIVVADDASTDGTHELLCDYKAKYPEKFVIKISKKSGDYKIQILRTSLAMGNILLGWVVTI